MKITINPTEEPNIRNEHVMAALGLIPPWIKMAWLLRPHDVVTAVVDEMYGMGGGPQDGFTMETDGTMLYEGDPPLTPIAMYEPDPEMYNDGVPQGWVYKVYQYDYGYVNFVSKNEDDTDHLHMTRMD